MRHLSILYFLLWFHPVFAAEFVPWGIVAGYFGGAISYLAVALPFIVPKAQERQEAADRRDEVKGQYNQAQALFKQISATIAETHARMNGTDCAKGQLSQFQEQVALLCNRTIAQNGLSFIYKQTTSNSYTTEEYYRECVQIPHTVCTYHPTSCSTHYTTDCYNVYYTRVHETEQNRDGYYLQGENSVNSGCHYYTQGLSMKGREFVETTAHPVWSDSYQRAVNYWASSANFEFDLDEHTFTRHQVLDEKRARVELEGQVQEFMEVHCSTAMALVENRSSLFYDSEWTGLNASLPGLEAQQQVQEKIVSNYSTSLSEKESVFDDADERYKKQLAIHLPLLFLGFPAAVGIPVAYGIVRAINRCHSQR